MLGMMLPPASEELSGPEKLVLSVVVPVFNEEENIPALLNKLTAVCKDITDRYEIISIDDGSRDRSWEILAARAASDPHIKAISFSRNFGHQVAITAGMEMSKGEAVVVIDADLQDPPELIKDLVAKWREGFDVIYAVRQKRAGESWAKLITANLFYRMIKRLTQFNIPVDTGDFRLMNRRAVQAFLAMPERQRFVRGMVAWVGFRQVGIFYSRAERFKGVTKYTYKKMFRFAFDGITSFSYLPLQAASYLGFVCAGVSFILIFYALLIKVGDHRAIQGWASTVVITLFLGGVQLIMIGLLGEYLGRIHEELKRRPLYIVKEAANISFRS